MENYPVTLSVLTWKSPVTLQQTLESLTPILPLFTERLVVCQESDPEEIELAMQMGFRVVPTETNIGIQNGLKKAVSAAKNEFVLVLENDANYTAGDPGVLALQEALAQITTTPIDHIRLGELNKTPSKKYSKFWTSKTPPFRRFFGFLRWNLANTHKHEALSMTFENEVKSFPGFTKVSDSFWLSTSKYVTWTNRSFLTRKSFFLGKLIPFAETHPTSRLINGYPDLEHPINCRRNRYWWCAQKFSIGISVPGLFGHSRYDRTPEDEKNP